MPLSKATMEFEYRIKTGLCEACNRIAPINRHHPDYSKPGETIILCCSCHKKTHMYLNGTVRTGSRPYINPMINLEKRRAKRVRLDMVERLKEIESEAKVLRERLGGT